MLAPIVLLLTIGSASGFSFGARAVNVRGDATALKMVRMMRVMFCKIIKDVKEVCNC
jgi:hypothetical protein